MKNKQYKLDIIPGIVIALFSIGYMAMIPSIKTFTGLGATPLTNHFFPICGAAPYWYWACGLRQEASASARSTWRKAGPSLRLL